MWKPWWLLWPNIWEEMIVLWMVCCRESIMANVKYLWTFCQKCLLFKGIPICSNLDSGCDGWLTHTNSEIVLSKWPILVVVKDTCSLRNCCNDAYHKYLRASALCHHFHSDDLRMPLNYFSWGGILFSQMSILVSLYF